MTSVTTPPIGNRALAALVARGDRRLARASARYEFASVPARTVLARNAVAEPVAEARKGVRRRPQGDRLWTAYEKVKYGVSARDVWNTIGGSLARRFSKAVNGGPAPSCAARLSRALNECGSLIPGTAPGALFNNPKVVHGDDELQVYTRGDGRHYIVLARNMKKYLRGEWGSPDATLTSGAEATEFAQRLGTSQTAVFAGVHHVGVMRNGYQDAYVFTDADVLPVSAWILPL